jgi:hypothetical protein
VDGGLARRKATTYTQETLLWVGFEPTIPAFERAETVHALDRAATVIGVYLFIPPNFFVFSAVRVVWEDSRRLFRGFSPQANYTDRAIVACRRS